jgi:N-acetyl-alpha-D-muramate 1-phosphate uridylyltransferase
VSELLPVCILAGGLGTRLGEHVRDTPKPMIPVAGKPFLLWQLDLLREHGARRIVLCVGYKGEQIAHAVGDGSHLGLDAMVVFDPPELAGTAGAIRGALEHLGDAFLVLYGDTYLRIDYRGVQAAWNASGLPAMMTVLRNDGQWDVSNVHYDDGRVLAYDKRSPTPEMRWIDYGLGLMTPAALSTVPDAADLADVYHVLAQRGELAGYAASERFYEIGTPESLAETDAFLRRS